MKDTIPNAAQVLSRATTQLQQGHVQKPNKTAGQDRSSTANGITQDDIDQLFTLMAGLYGFRWTSQQGEYDASGAWFAELRQLSKSHLNRGLKRCREQIRSMARANDTAWPPQAAEFAILCEPRAEDFGLPNEDNAWAEANAHAHEPDTYQWSHPAVLMAGRAINGGFAAIHSTTALSARTRMERHFKRQYQALVNRVMAGEQLVARGLIESDANKHPAELAERAGRERAQHSAERYAHCTTREAALAEMRRVIGA